MDLSNVKPIELTRVAVRVPAALGWTLALHYSARFRQIVIGGKWRDRNFQDLIGVWGTGLAWIMGIRIVKRNERTGPMGDMIIANHLGMLDIPSLLCAYPAVFMISKEYSRFFYIGRLLTQHGHVFVERGSAESRRSAREGLRRVLERGERIIVFPEGRSSPGAERLPFKPFSFHEAARQGKLVEACVIDYLPDRSLVKWDNKQPILPQFLKLLGRRRTQVSLEFFPAERIEDPEEAIQRYHDLMEGRLKAYDAERQSSSSPDAEPSASFMRRSSSAKRSRSSASGSSPSSASLTPAVGSSGSSTER
jgi:1-acyl-sn-glycerol-3-phosphate acyltransferase